LNLVLRHEEPIETRIECQGPYHGILAAARGAPVARLAQQRRVAQQLQRKHRNTRKTMSGVFQPVAMGSLQFSRRFQSRVLEGQTCSMGTRPSLVLIFPAPARTRPDSPPNARSLSTCVTGHTRALMARLYQGWWEAVVPPAWDGSKTADFLRARTEKIWRLKAI
jgi:hypothetical protein